MTFMRRLLAPLPKWARIMLAILCFLTGAVLSVRLSVTSVPDPFYTAPADLPETPGVLIKQEPFTRDVPNNAE